ncbi:MAG: MFS transporter [Burkholderiales bacterium]
MSTAATTTGLRISIVWLIFAGVCSPLGFNVTPALLPPIQAEFALDTARMQWMVSLYSLTLGLGQLLGGPLADALGRRSVLLAGLAIFVAGSAAAALAPTYEALLGARLAQGLGACATLVVPRATVRDTHSGNDAARAMALVMLSLAFTPLLAPFFGAFIETHFGWRAAFVACALVGAAIFAGALRLHTETLPRERRIPLKLLPLAYGYVMVLRSWRFCAYATSFSLLNCTFIGLMVVGPPYFARAHGLSSNGIALAMLAAYLGFTFGNFAAARRVRRAGVDRLIAAGVLTCAIGSLLLFPALASGSLSFLLLGLFLQALGTGFAFSPGIAGATATLPERAGTAAAMTGAIQLGGGALFAFATGALDDGTFQPHAWACTSVCAAAGLLAWPLWHGRHRRPVA